MISIGLLLIGIPAALFLLAYVGYPLVLALMPNDRVAPGTKEEDDEWPEVTICVPVFNEEGSIRGTLEGLLALDYPPARRQIVVVSDASTDRTDAIVAEFLDRGIRLIRLERRGGKTAAENAVGRELWGEVVVNTDATIRIPPDSLKELVRVFRDPTVGVASGRDVSVGDQEHEANRGESSYVNYEMWVRSLETRAGSIVGASGCFYAIRRELFDTIFPEALSRDFASPLIAREHGYRSVSVDAALAQVPRTRSLRAEFRRKVRTMTRGLETLWYKRDLMSVPRYGRFALMLILHKLVRWLVFLTTPLAVVGLLLIALAWPPAWLAVAGLGVVLALTLIAVRVEDRGRLPRPVAVIAFAGSTVVAGALAWARALAGELDPVWEPTRRPGIREPETQ